MIFKKTGRFLIVWGRKVSMRIGGTLAFLTDQTICADITVNKYRKMDKFKELFKNTENYKHRLPEFQIENSIEDRYATEKNNRIIIVLTIALIFLTIVLLLKT